jgi:polyisoprenoid-binding protein YceI
MLTAMALLLATASTQLMTLQPSHLVLDGSANVGRWRCQSRNLQSQMTVAATLPEINAAADRIAELAEVSVPSIATPEFRLRIPIAAIQCANRLMEREMSHALRSSAHPAITFELHDVNGPIRHEASSGRYSAGVEGDLTVAGVTKRIRFPINAWRLSPSSVYVRASIPLKMRDFGVQPPRSLFGLIRARDEIMVYFDLRMSVVEQ